MRRYILGALGALPILLLGCSQHVLAQDYIDVEQTEELMRELLPEVLGSDRFQQEPYREDPRTPEQQAEYEEFIRAWRLRSPNIATFLGEWHGISGGQPLIYAIYPSDEDHGGVCIIRYSPSEEPSYRLLTGYLRGANQAQLYLPRGENFITFLQHLPEDLVESTGEHLIQVTVEEGGSIRFSTHVAFPRLLQEPHRWLPQDILNGMQFWNSFIGEGCTANLPQARPNVEPNYELSGEQTLQGVTLRFTGAYVNPSPTNRSIEAFWEIENASGQEFRFITGNVTVENTMGQELCPNARVPREVIGENGETTVELTPVNPENLLEGCASFDIDDGYDSLVEAGQRITGRVRILLSPSEVAGFYLILPERTTLNPREFRVPIELGGPLAD